MKTLLTHSVLILIPMIFIGCGSGAGPDSISSHKAYAPVSGCTAKCHNASSTISPDPLITNGTGTKGKHIAHVVYAGFDCEKCHLNYSNQATHMNGKLDTGPSVTIVYFDSTNPTPPAQWVKSMGPPASGICSNLVCHGTDTLDWYGTAGWTLPDCSACHSAPTATRRQVFGTAGDFASNPTVTSHHVTSGTADPSTAQCKICHDVKTTHMAGTVSLRNADTGFNILYTSPASLEPFCLSCHDADGATYTFVSGGTPTSPFNDGSVLGSPPYSYATRIASSWAKSYGHGPNGNHGANDRLTCMGSGQPGTGCHGSNGNINAHGSVNQVLSSREFKYNIGANYNEADYDICFSCHSNYAGVRKEDTLGVKHGGKLDWDYGILTGPNGTNGWNPPYYTPGVTTHFADHNDPLGGTLNDPPFWGENFNLHWFHLGGPTFLRGTASWSGITCVNCHDVHGSTTPYGAVYDELVYSNTLTLGNNLIGQMVITAYTGTLLGDYPAYCSFNCHSVQGPTKAWFYPIAE